MNAKERVEALILLARLQGWDSTRLHTEVITRYPLGPSPEGPSWNSDEGQFILKIMDTQLIPRKGIT